MAKRTNPTLVGAFVLAAFLLLIAGMVFLGGGDWFTEKRRYVIYFNNAIKGLTVGAPVTFKGVQVGRVAGLKVHYDQNTGTTEIPVLIDVDPAKMVTLDKDEEARAKLLQQMIAQGLRAQLNPESLITNQQVVQLDFFPGTAVRLVESKLPYPQIPSVPSAFDQLQQSLGNTAQSLPELTASATIALNGLAAVLSPENQRKVAHILDNLDQLSGDLAAHGGDLGKTLVSLQQASEKLNRMLSEVDQVIGENRKPLTEAVASLADTAQSVHQLTAQLEAILGENRAGLADFTNGSLYELSGLITDSRTLVRRATDVLDQLNRNPQAYLLGNHDQGVPIK